ncbi:hypothetical protein VTJ04DRAFT_2217 [Mycothermus thermophilus]|uniref:uncharacterized protein n=1 Tax=Humicola insolens TaxID=85995 RepID=UPI003743EBB5
MATVFHGLLLSCRTLHSEVAALIYSSIHFTLFYHEPSQRFVLSTVPQNSAPRIPLPPDEHWQRHSPLHTLRVLTLPALQALLSLKLVLNEAGCHNGHWDYWSTCCSAGPALTTSTCLGAFKCANEHQGQHSPPLLSSGCGEDDTKRIASAYAVVKEWQEAARRLFSHVTPGRLRFSVVCDIDPAHPQCMEIANAIVEPLRLLPRGHLRECHIRLAKTPDARLKQLARDVGTHAAGLPISYLTPSSNPSAPNLATLPRELRLRILEYTDLVTPCKQVVWCRFQRAYYVLQPHTCFLQGSYPYHLFKCWTNLSSNGNCRSTLAWQEELHKQKTGSFANDFDPIYHGCFCSRRHSAFSPSCRCWAPPGPDLFLINTSLCQDAQYVFFSQNRFTVHDNRADDPYNLRLLPAPGADTEHRPWTEVPLYPELPYPFPRLAIAEFLRDAIPRHCISHLRLLELGFPYYTPGAWPDANHPAMRDWWETARLLEEYATLSTLTIKVTAIGEDEWDDRAGDDGELQVHHLSPEGAERILEALWNLVRPFKGWGDRGLHGFFLNFSHPVQLTKEGRRQRAEKKREYVPELDMWGMPGLILKWRVEREVLGKRYKQNPSDPLVQLWLGPEESVWVIRPTDWPVDP